MGIPPPGGRCRSVSHDAAGRRPARREYAHTIVFDLPEPFWGQRLLTVRVRDAGADGFQRVLVTAATAAVTTLITGDATLDGRVYVADFARVAANFNPPGGWQSGDFNQDGVVGLGDFGRLAANFNYAYPAEEGDPGAAVPEPAAAAGVAALYSALRLVSTRASSRRRRAA